MKRWKILIIAFLFLSAVLFKEVVASELIEKIVEKDGKAVAMIVTYDKESKPLSQGSCFIVDAEGIIVTNLHVISNAYSGVIKLTNGAFYRIKEILGEDADVDIAFLKVEGKELPTVELGDSDKVKVGESVIAIGNPQGLQNSVSTGIISGIREIEFGNKVYKLIQTITPISPGSSGGVLLNMEGKVIGITESSLIEGQNLNFAIPINYVKQLITQAAEPIDQGVKKYLNYYFLGYCI